MSVITELQKDVESLAKRVEHLEGKGAQDLEGNLRMDGAIQKLREVLREQNGMLAKGLEEVLSKTDGRLLKLEGQAVQNLESDLQMGRLLQTLGKEVHLLQDVVVAAAAIRRKINGQLRMLNTDAWLGPEMRALDEAFKAVEEWEGV